MGKKVTVNNRDRFHITKEIGEEYNDYYCTIEWVSPNEYCVYNEDDVWIDTLDTNEIVELMVTGSVTRKEKIAYSTELITIVPA